MPFYSGKAVLVTGGTGLIGWPLVELLLGHGARARVVSLYDPARAPSGSELRRTHHREFNECIKACDGMQYVFHLAGVKGSPKITALRSRRVDDNVRREYNRTSSPQAGRVGNTFPIKRYRS